jgi:peptidoglycan/LPS O-acetylase OafA/YrhL
MKAKASGVAATPKAVRVALWMNLVLVASAVVLPRVLTDQNGSLDQATAAALWFVVPMALVFAIGVAAATRAYLLARRAEQRMKWSAFLPLAMFVVGIAATLALVYFETSEASEFVPSVTR